MESLKIIIKESSHLKKKKNSLVPSISELQHYQPALLQPSQRQELETDTENLADTKALKPL